MRPLALAALAMAGVGVLAPAPAFAHDLWLHLDRWASASPKVDITGALLIGHVADGTEWRVAPDRIVSLVSVGPDGAERDQRDNLRFDAENGVAVDALRLSGYGVHVVAFESTEAFSALLPERFDAYAEEEGLAAVIAARRGAKGPGREFYSRRTKALIRLGPGDGPAPTAIGQTLELVPLDNPYTAKPGEPLRVRVDYKGAPLAGASVSLESLSVGLLPKLRRTTDAGGVAVFERPRSGAWKLNVVWSEPIEDPEADFRTVFSSLTWGE